MAKKPMKFVKRVVDKMHKGAMTAQAHEAGESPMEFAREHKHSAGVTGKRARFALLLRSFHKKK